MGNGLSSGMSMNCPRRRHPHLATVSCGGEVLQRAAQVAQAIRLTYDIGVQGDAHHQRRSARRAGLIEHFIQLVDDHLGEVFAVHLARDDHRDVVQLLRVGHGPQGLAAARA